MTRVIGGASSQMAPAHQRLAAFYVRLLRRFANSRWSAPLWRMAFFCLSLDWRVELRNYQQLAVLRARGVRIIYVCRHGNILPSLGYMAHLLLPQGRELRPLNRPAMLTDGGPEGRIVEFITRGRGNPVIRTHDHRTALLQLAEVMGKGYDAAMTLDQRRKDPSGRWLSVDQPGCALLAYRTGAVVVPVAAGCRIERVLTEVWDRLEIPVPGFFGVLRFGQPIAPPSDRSPGALLEKTREIGRALDELKGRVDVERELDRRKALGRLRRAAHGLLFILGLLIASANYRPYITLLGILLAFREGMLLAAYTAGFSTRLMTNAEATVGEARAALAALFGKARDETTRDGERTIKVLSGNLEPLVYGHPAVLRALATAVEAGAIPQFIVNSPPELLPEPVQTWAKDRKVLLFIHRGALPTPHFAVVNQRHARLEWTHEAGHPYVTLETPRRAETHFYTERLGGIYDRIFDSLRDHRGTAPLEWRRRDGAP